MSGDFSGQRFDSARDFSNLLLQQGRVTLDTDWNELAAIIERRVRSGTVDAIGRSAVPRETLDGFKISCMGSGAARALSIGRGRIYVDGHLVENHGPPPFSFDMASINAKGEMSGVLGEQIGAAAIAYAAQPYPFKSKPPGAASSLLVYVDVWQREVTYVEDGRLLEPALGGVDTSTRTQTVWQVKYLDLVGADAGIKCAKADKLAAWQDLIKPSAGRLTTRLSTVPDANDPCLLPPTAGYRGLENQNYRIEIHTGGNAATTTFKWSRDNASIVANVLGIKTNVIKVTSIGRDPVLRFRIGDTLEITDDIRELNGDPGELHVITGIDEGLREVTLAATPSTSLIPAGPPADSYATRHTRIRRWDSAGALPVNMPNTLKLENGIEISFTLDPAGGTFRSGDYWNFAARAADTSIELLTSAPPRGIHHHYARLAIATAAGTVEDCRTIWPPEAEDCCGCTVCVTPQSHADGSLTIQGAIDRVIKAGGGTVCLDVGTYPIIDPIKINGGESLRLVGQGCWKTILTWAGQAPAISISNSNNVVAEAFDVKIDPFTRKGCASAFVLEQTMKVTIRDCWVLQDLTNARGVSGPMVLLRGTQTGTLIERNVFVGFDGISGGVDSEVKPSMMVVRENCFLSCKRRGIFFGGDTTYGEMLIVNNVISGCTEGGIECRGQTPKGIRVMIDGNVLGVVGPGIVARTETVSILHNNIIGADKGKKQDGIVLFEVEDCDVIGNRIRNMAGAGVWQNGHVGSAMIKQNIIQNTRAGIVIESPAGAAGAAPTPWTRIVAIENNQLCDIAKAPAGTGGTAAISAIRVDQLRISANTIRGLTPASIDPPLPDGVIAPALAAIDIRICGTVLVSANNIVDVVAPAGKPACGIWVREVTFSTQITDNVIRRGSGPASGVAATPWYAIYFGSGPPTMTTASTGPSTADSPAPQETAPLIEAAADLGAAPAGVPAPLEMAPLIEAAADLGATPPASSGWSNSDVLVAGQATILKPDPHRPQISILGNNCTSWESTTPVIWAQWASGSCTFSNNQCELSVDSTAESAVFIDGANVAVIGNVVRALHSPWTMEGQVPSRAITFKASTPANDVPNYAAILGNLTLGGIWVGSNQLGGNWADLNQACT